MNENHGTDDNETKDETVDKKKIKLEEKRLKQEEKRLKEELLAKERKEKSLKQMKYLLRISLKFSDYYKNKMENDLASGINKKKQKKNQLETTIMDMKDAASCEQGNFEPEEKIDVTQQLRYFLGDLRPYQIEGVNWLKGLYNHAINGILADEMGLGKTIQVIALICHLYETGVEGPFLVIVPLSTVPNWEAEFKRFAPRIPFIVCHGSAENRFLQLKKINRQYLLDGHYIRPVVITTYEIAIRESNSLKELKWLYTVVDEGHRLKNKDCRLKKILHTFTSANKLLLTGTPLQNNITELWSLLNFLMPQIFKDMNTFAYLIMLEDVEDQGKFLKQEEKDNVISTIHNVLKPFMLRRLKKDVLHDNVPKKELHVFCPLSELQRKLYSYVIEKNIESLLGIEEKKENDQDFINKPRGKRLCTVTKKNYTSAIDDLDNSDDDGDVEMVEYENLKGIKMSLTPKKKQREAKNFITRLTMQRPITMYQKIVNHPYLIHFPLDTNEGKPTLRVDEDLIKSSGKMMVLDAMLPRLKQNHHKVLIFSTMTMLLDMLEEFMIMRGHSYCRLDGSHKLSQRGESIQKFNEDPDVLAFLISTRAGGLGLNLTAADTVIFYDRDWNPQADIQAADRCHRIGQTKPVMIYTLVTKNTIDEKVIKRGHQKRILEKLVIKDGQFRTLKNDEKSDMQETLKELKDLLERENDNFEGKGISNKELDKIMDRSSLYEEMARNRREKDM